MTTTALVATVEPKEEILQSFARHRVIAQAKSPSLFGPFWLFRSNLDIFHSLQCINDLDSESLIIGILWCYVHMCDLGKPGSFPKESQHQADEGAFTEIYWIKLLQLANKISMSCGSRCTSIMLNLPSLLWRWLGNLDIVCNSHRWELGYPHVPDQGYQPLQKQKLGMGTIGCITMACTYSAGGPDVNWLHHDISI